MISRNRSWIGGLVLGLLVLGWTAVTTAVAVAGATVGPPTSGQRR